MACKFCAWICHWLCVGANPIDAYWDRADDWERGQSNESELFCAASQEHRDRIDAALAMREADLEAAFRIFVDVADAGIAGHPLAGLLLARLKLLGKFGVREIWPGFRQIKKLTDRSGTVSSASDAQGVAMAPDQVQAVG